MQNVYGGPPWSVSTTTLVLGYTTPYFFFSASATWRGTSSDTSNPRLATSRIRLALT
jgi:hypothetical protein